MLGARLWSCLPSSSIHALPSSGFWGTRKIPKRIHGWKVEPESRFGASRRSDLMVLYVTRDETYAANDEDVSP